MKCVIVTACAVGIAHTYMAAEAMERAAKKAGIDVFVETQGSVGIEDEAPADKIADADFIIIASDITIEKPERFEGKYIYHGLPSEAIKHPQQLVDKAIASYQGQEKSE